MKSPVISYYEAENLSDAIKIKSSDDDSVIIAGGQSLMPTLNMRLSNPSLLIDISKISSLKNITEENSYLIIDALCTHSEVMNNIIVNEKMPIIPKILSEIAHPAIRNRGTHGGSIAYGDPAAELPALAVLLNADIVLCGLNGERTVSARKFYKGLFETEIKPDEILTRIRYPITNISTKLFFEEVTRRHGDYAMAGLMGSISKTNSKISDMKLVFFGTGDKPNEADKTSNFLISNQYEYSSVKKLLHSEIEFSSDINSSSDMKAHLSTILVEKMLKELC